MYHFNRLFEHIVLILNKLKHLMSLGDKCRILSGSHPFSFPSNSELSISAKQRFLKM